MKPTQIENLAGGILTASHGEWCKASDKTWLQLAVLGLVRGGEAGAPMLTERGEEVFAAIERGDEIIPELDAGYAD